MAKAATVASFIAEFLRAQGVTHLFEVTGGHIVPLIDEVATLGGIRIVTAHHEQGAGFAAEAQARLTRRPGIVVATSGPGALNLLSALASAYFDSVPLIAFTGQVTVNQLRGARPIRQLGFQETDIVSVVSPIVKAAFQLTDASKVGEVLEAAFRVATAGRPGPVLVDLPSDVLRGAVGPLASPRAKAGEPAPDLSATVAELAGALERAQRPLVLVGGGVRAAGAADELRAVLRRWGLPAVTSLLGLDAIGHDDPHRVGFIGTWGNRWANLALGGSDLLLVLGSRLDARQTGHDLASFARRTIYQVDCDAGEINNRVKGVHPIVADAKTFLSAMLDHRGSVDANRFADWRRAIEGQRKEFPDTAELRNLVGLNPNVVMRELGGASGQATTIVFDVGQHQLWAAQSLVFGSHQRVLNSGGLGAMGYCLPAAIGAALTRPGPVLAITGDGAFQLNIQELQTLVRNALPVKMVLLNNHAHGMVRQLQEVMCQGRYQSAVVGQGYSAPDFCKVVEAYGIPARALPWAKAKDRPDLALREAFEWLWRDPHHAAFLEVEIPQEANVRPETAPGGRAVFEMMAPERARDGS